MEMDDEEKTAKFIQQQVERALATEKEGNAVEFTELQRDDEEEKVTFSLSKTKKDEPSSSSIKFVFLLSLCKVSPY